MSFALTKRYGTIQESLHVLLAGLFFRCLTFSALLLIPQYLPAFDESAAKVLSTKDLWLQGLLRWDALYFERIARNGYTVEQEFAFMPALPFIMRLFGTSFGFHAFDSAKAVLYTSVLALIVSSVSVVLLHRLSLKVIKDPTHAYITALLFCITPSPATLVSPYNEPFFGFFVFAGYLAYEGGRYPTSAALFSLATAFRANGVLNAGFFVFRFLRHSTGVWLIVQTALCIAITIFPFVQTQYRGFELFCLDMPTPRPWCFSRLPSIYSFVQDHYWDVGFLRYWTLLQLPLFLLSAPVLLLCFAASFKYYMTDPLQSLLLSLPGRLPLNRLSETGYSRNALLLPYIHLNTAVTCLFLFVSHVQICLRQVSANPVPYWFAAYLLQSGSKYGRWWKWYCIVWGAISVVLWAGFYPPA